MDWITEVWNKVLAIVNSVGTSLDDLVARIDSVQFSNEMYLSKFLATIHYIVGTTNYIMLMSILLIGTGFMILKCIQAVLNIIQKTLPGLKGKINIS